MQCPPLMLRNISVQIARHWQAKSVVHCILLLSWHLNWLSEKLFKKCPEQEIALALMSCTFPKYKMFSISFSVVFLHPCCLTGQILCHSKSVYLQKGVCHIQLSRIFASRLFISCLGIQIQKLLSTKRGKLNYKIC